MRPTPLPPRWNPRTGRRLMLQFLVGVAVIWVASRAWVVVSWTLLALVLALALAPCVRWMQQWMPRGLAVLAIALCVLAGAGFAALHFGPLLITQARLLVEHLPGWVVWLREQESFAWFERSVLQADLASELRSQAPHLAAPVLSVLRGLFSGLLATLSVVTLAAFMLAYGPALVESALGWLRPSQRELTRRLVESMERKVGGFVAASLVMAALTGAVTSILMAVLRVPFFLPVGLVCALLSLIPFAGSAATLVLVGAVALATRGVHAALLAVAVLLLYFQLKDKLLDPLVMRWTIDMNPLLITEVLLLGTALAGLFGTVLAMPVAGAAQVLLADMKARRQARWARSEKLRSGDGPASHAPQEPAQH
jgi:putative heme transporter